MNDEERDLMENEGSLLAMAGRARRALGEAILPEQPLFQAWHEQINNLPCAVCKTVTIRQHQMIRSDYNNFVIAMSLIGLGLIAALAFFASSL